MKKKKKNRVGVEYHTPSEQREARRMPGPGPNPLPRAFPLSGAGRAGVKLSRPVSLRDTGCEGSHRQGGVTFRGGRSPVRRRGEM